MGKEPPQKKEEGSSESRDKTGLEENRKKLKDEQNSQSFNLADFWEELKQRKVVQVGITYLVVSWVILQVADLTFEAFDIPNWALQFVFVLLGIGLLVSLILTWIYELTPHGIRTTTTARKEQGEDVGEPGHQGKRTALVFLFAAAVPALIFGMLTIVLYFQAKSASDELIMVTSTMAEEEKSIAVLPLENLSVDEGDSFLATGLHNELTTVVSRIRALKTISRNSTIRYRDTTMTHQAIAYELGVVNLLTGAVQRIGENIRINVQLIDPKTDRSIWGESFIRKFTPDNLFAIQSEICRAIALQLSVMLTPEENKSIARVPTQSLEAFEAYLKGNEMVANGNWIRMPEAVEWFKRAVELDPEFTLAYIGLALSYENYGTSLNERSLGWETIKEKLEERRKKMHVAAEKAFALDYNLPEVQILQGIIHYKEQHYAMAEASMKRAIELNSNSAEANYRLGRLLWFLPFTYAGMEARYAPDGRGPGIGVVMNRFRGEVASYLSKAIELEPTNASYRSQLAYVLWYLGRPEEEIAQYKKAIDLNPDQASLHWILGLRLMVSMGRNDEALVHLRKCLALDPLTRRIDLSIAEAYENMGDLDEAARWMRRAIAVMPPMAPLFEIRLLEFRGEDELALKAYRAHLNGRSMSPRPKLKVFNDDLRTGRYEEAKARYFKAFPKLFEPDVSIKTHSRDFSSALRQFGSSAMELAAILMATGETEQANRLMDETWSYFQFHPDRKIQETLILVLRGDNKRALQVLRSAFDEGLHDRNKFLDARLDPIRNEPEFIDMMEVIDADLAKQLANVRRMEANGELEAIPELSATLKKRRK